MTDEDQGGVRYRVTSSSRRSAVVQRQFLTLRDPSDTKLTRKYIDPTVVENPRDPRAAVEITLGHQRRARTGAPWEEEPPFNLARLPAGQEVRLILDSEQTLGLYQHLRRLYEIARPGVAMGEHLVTVWDADVPIVTGTAREILRNLLETQGEGVFQLIASMESDLLTAAALARTHAQRQAAFETFQAHVQAGDWTELDWQRFFEANPWIFGHGLDYRFLVTRQTQADYGGGNVLGRGGQQGDFLMTTEADVRFSVLVEIKKPTTQLLGSRQYRNGAWQIGPDLSGGVAQVQAHCDQWAREGSATRANRRWLEERGIAVVQPKGILLIGHTGHLDTDDKKETFERFRRNLWNPEVLSYDELLARARFLVEQAADTKPVTGDDVIDVDDIPF